MGVGGKKKNDVLKMAIQLGADSTLTHMRTHNSQRCSKGCDTIHKSQKHTDSQLCTHRCNTIHSHTHTHTHTHILTDGYALADPGVLR